jgi:hypothetical protein
MPVAHWIASGGVAIFPGREFGGDAMEGGCGVAPKLAGRKAES